MINLLDHMRLSAKISLLGAGCALFTALALLGLAAWQSGQYQAVAQQKVDVLTGADLDHITESVYNLVHTENEAVQQQLNDNLRVARHVLDIAGDVSLSTETVTWLAVSQLANAAGTVRLPKMMIGGRWLGLIFRTHEADVCDFSDGAVGFLVPTCSRAPLFVALRDY
jgi:hypothetical protein